MSAWSQPDLPFDDPVTVLPRDGRARMIFAWRGPGGRPNRQWAAEVDDVQTVRSLLRSVPDVYDTQWWMDRPMRRHAFALAGTHAFCDFDYYKLPDLADQKPDIVGKALLRHCDDNGIPRPSAITCSGRGLNAKWCFSEPVGREHVGTMVALNRALQRRLTAFGADPQATDATRLLRVTGSLHSGAQRLVEVLHLEQRDGRTITYDPHAFAERITPRPTEAPAADIVLRPANDVQREIRRGHNSHHRFTREGWHWTLIEDMRTLPRLRYPNGIVPEGMRDTFAFLIACQLVRIFPPGEVFPEIAAVVSTIIEPGFVAKELMHLCSSAMQRARDAWAGRGWIHIYRYRKQTMIDMLEVTWAEQRQMGALIDEAEYRRRELARLTTLRRNAGAIERSAYEARAAERRPIVKAMRARGMTWRAIAAELGISVSEAHRLGELRAD
jgi:hypothetical protein